MSCDTCKHGVVTPVGLVCRRFPPTVLLVPHPHAPAQRVPASVFPPVQKDHECGEYAANLAAAN